MNTHDPDVSSYHVYRSTQANFVVDTAGVFASTIDTAYVDATLNPSTAYYYRITTVDIHGNGSVPTAQLYSPNALTSRAAFKLLLEGPYNTGTLLMNKTLRTGGHLAAHFGSIPVPSEAVDSIGIELRNAASAVSATTRKYRPAWLLTDGTIRDFVDTTKNYVEYDTLAGNYFIVVYHRNHIPIMTAVTQSLNGSTPSAYDFTTAQAQAYGSNSMKQIGSVYAMIAGDASGNGQVANSDINNVIRPTLGQSGYKNGDANLNGQVQNSDMNTYTRPNLGRGTQVPARPTTSNEKEK
jgi:hypothetical protein